MIFIPESTDELVHLINGHVARYGTCPFYLDLNSTVQAAAVSMTAVTKNAQPVNAPKTLASPQAHAKIGMAVVDFLPLPGSSLRRKQASVQKTKPHHRIESGPPESMILT